MTMSNGNVSDEEWLITRARKSIKTDPYAAKVWMITAQSLFPGNFAIQFESYNLEKERRNESEAAKLLEIMFKSFPEEQTLMDEVQSMLEAMQADIKDSKSQLLTDIFAAIPANIQCPMLLSVADKITNTMDHCRLLLLAMKKFPNLIQEHVLKLVDKLLSAERHSNYTTPVNSYRKFLVCDVLPLILHKCQIELTPKMLYKWLQKSIQFYIAYVTLPPATDVADNLSPSHELLSPTSKKALSQKKQLQIMSLSEKESHVPDPWASLFTLLINIANQLGWDIEPDLHMKSRDSQWQHILSLYNRDHKVEGSPLHKQILYTTVVVFLEGLYNYVSSVDPELFAYGNPVSGQTVPLILIEAFSSDTAGTSHSKALPRKAPPQVHSSPMVANSSKVVQNFVTALKCYELLHSSEALRHDFIKLCQSWMMETWTWMGHFQTDMFIYQGSFQDAVAHLQNFGVSMKGNLKLRNSLQMASCYYSLGQYSKSCELILDIISSLPSVPEAAPTDVTKMLTHGPGRHLILTTCMEAEILPYCIQSLVTCFKEKSFSQTTSDDMCLGHLIVLMQYDWPREEPLFNQVIQKIQAKTSFTYNMFFTYVINLDILEEISFLKTVEGGKVNLDILPTSTQLIALQRTVTRGVNKGVKEDFRSTMQKQVRRCEESVINLIRQFLTVERNLLLHAIR